MTALHLDNARRTSNCCSKPISLETSTSARARFLPSKSSAATSSRFSACRRPSSRKTCSPASTACRGARLFSSPVEELRPLLVKHLHVGQEVYVHAQSKTGFAKDAVGWSRLRVVAPHPSLANTRPLHQKLRGKYVSSYTCDPHKVSDRHLSHLGFSHVNNCKLLN
jgi:hypothetical protein